MPELLKNEKGKMDLSKVFRAFAAAFVLILQQWQAYRIAEIQAEAKANKESFMPRKEVYEHIQKVEDSYVPKNEMMAVFKDVDKRLKDIEQNIKGK